MVSSGGSGREWTHLFPSFRFVILLLTQMFLVLLPGAMFQTLSFGISCMVNRTIEDIRENETRLSGSNAQCVLQSQKTVNTSTGAQQSSRHLYEGPFDWDKTIQSNLLAGYAYGGLIMVYLSGLICDKFGSKLIMSINTIVGIVSVVLTPVAATYGGWIPVFIARVILGLACGCGWPVAANVASKWSGPKEVTVFLSIAGTGFGIGAFIFNAINGFVCVQLGWEWIFYYTAGVTSAYFIVLLIFFSSTPMESKWVSNKERYYIDSHKEQVSNANDKDLEIPWKQLLSSLPVLAVIICGFCQFCIEGFVAIMLPTYFTEAFGTPPEKTGFYSSVVNGAQVVGRFGTGFIAEYIKPFGRRETWNTKFYNSLAFAIVFICFLSSTFFTCGQDEYVVAIMTIQFGMGSLVLAGYLRAALLIAPTFVGQIMGLSHVGAYLGSIVMPYLSSALTPHGTIAEWKNAIYFVMGMVGLGSITFLLIGSADVQAWAKEMDSKQAFEFKADRGTEKASKVIETQGSDL